MALLQIPAERAPFSSLWWAAGAWYELTSVHNCVCVNALILAYHLIFGPQQIEASTVDGRAEEVQAMVGNTEVQVTKPEHHPVKEGWSIILSCNNRQGMYVV